MKRLLYFSVIFLLRHFSSTAQPVVAQLDVPMIKQLRSNWCWAACADMVDEFHYRDVLTPPARNQCDIANFYINRVNQYLSEYEPDTDPLVPISTADCPLDCICKEGDASSGNFKMPYNFPPAYFIGTTYHTVFLDLGYYSSLDKNMTFEEVKRDILDCRPIVLGIKYGGGTSSSGDHIVVATGYENIPGEPKIILVNDPLDGDSCKTCEIEKINMDALAFIGCVPKIEFYLAGIRRKNMPSCDSCSYDTSMFSRWEETTTLTTIEKRIQHETFGEIVKKLDSESFIKIPINHVIINSKKRYGIFDNLFDTKNLIRRDTDYFYYTEQKSNVLTRQLINGKLMVTQIKSCGYPTQFTISTGLFGIRKIKIDLVTEKNSKLDVYRIHGPIYKDYYFYTKDNKTYRIEPDDIIRGNDNKIEKPVNPVSRRKLNRELKLELKPITFKLLASS